MDTKREVQVITRQEEQYPEKFRQLSDMPEKFWLMGDCGCKKLQQLWGKYGV